MRLKLAILFIKKTFDHRSILIFLITLKFVSSLAKGQFFLTKRALEDNDGIILSPLFSDPQIL